MVRPNSTWLNKSYSLAVLHALIEFWCDVKCHLLLVNEITDKLYIQYYSIQEIFLKKGDARTSLTCEELVSEKIFE